MGIAMLQAQVEWAYVVALCGGATGACSETQHNEKGPPKRSFYHQLKNQLVDLQEPGRYLLGMGLVAAGPHFHSVMVLPPSVVPTSAAAET
jgi:hypothetical protein